MNDAPTFKSAATTRSVSESATGGGKVGAPVTATDVDNNDTLTYSLTGTEARFFGIGPRSGQITVGDGVTFNIATKDTYTVTVAADDSHRDRATVAVTITVTSGPPITGGGGGGGGGGPPVVVEIDGASFAAADTETVFTAAVSDDARIGSLSWTVTGPDGFTATSNAERFSFVAPAGGAYTLSVTVDDTARRTLTGRVTLTVFGDITGHRFVNEILWLAEERITRGCAAHSHCPSNPVTRAQMATFLARALNLEAPPQPAGFADVDPSSAHAANIEALYAQQITTGCTQDPLAYCPSNPVTRAQMATFLARALNLEAPPQPAGFDGRGPLQRTRRQHRGALCATDHHRMHPRPTRLLPQQAGNASADGRIPTPRPQVRLRALTAHEEQGACAGGCATARRGGPRWTAAGLPTTRRSSVRDPDAPWAWRQEAGAGCGLGLRP